MLGRGEVSKASGALFVNNLKQNVASAYCSGKQLTYDGRFPVSRRADDTRASVMADAIVGLRDALYRIWPRAKEIKYVTDPNTILCLN